MKPLLTAALLSLTLLSTPLLLAKETTPADPKVIKMATTTSTENSGLLQDILPTFETKTGYSVQVIAVGSGKALKMGEDGDVDVVLSHAPAAEKEFVAKGFGDQRYPVMYNDFIVLGPKQTPPHLKVPPLPRKRSAKLPAKPRCLFPVAMIPVHTKKN
nr:substrate-binding domain-containing protein [Thiothrix subterranea]